MNNCFSFLRIMWERENLLLTEFLILVLMGLQDITGTSEAHYIREMHCFNGGVHILTTVLHPFQFIAPLQMGHAAT
jgi:hypothetical protein